MWLAGQITARGLGNDIALIIATGIVNRLPHGIAALVELSRQGAIEPIALPIAALVTAALIVLVVVAERSRPRVPVEFAGRQAGMQRQTVNVALKLNPAGLIPVYLASLLLTIVLVATMFVALQREGANGLIACASPSLRTLLHHLVTGALIAFFTLLYTAFVCDPTQMAARLVALGGNLPGNAPGEATAAHLASVISRSAGLGAAYLGIVMLLPGFLTSFSDCRSLSAGGRSSFSPCVVLDLAAEFRAYLAAG